jgi:hypothetical protein
MPLKNIQIFLALHLLELFVVFIYRVLYYDLTLTFLLKEEEKLHRKCKSLLVWRKKFLSIEFFTLIDIISETPFFNFFRQMFSLSIVS